jgi:hypothetical protein
VGTRLAALALMLVATAALAQSPTVTIADYFNPADLSPTGLVCDPPAKPPRPVLQPAEANVYARQWNGAGEPSLYKLAGDPAWARRKEYRFTYVRAFDPPIVVRVSQATDGTWSLIAKQLAATSMTSPWIVGERLERKMTEAEARRFSTLLASERLTDLRGGECARGVDGAAWILESLEDGKHRLFFRHSPYDSPVRDIGLAMLQLTGWAVEPIY